MAVEASARCKSGRFVSVSVIIADNNMYPLFTNYLRENERGSGKGAHNSEAGI